MIASMNKRQFLLAFLCVALITNLPAQTARLRKAEAAYSSYDFQRAISLFEQVSDKNTGIYRKLADSYRFSGNYAKAEENYRKVVESSNAEPADYYFYAQMLRTNNKYDEATTWLDKFHQADAADRRGAQYAQDKNYEEKLRADSGRYSIRLLGMNTAAQEFGPTYFGNQVVFASTRTMEHPVRRIYTWNGLPYLNVYVADQKDNDLTDINSLQKTINKKYHEGPVSFSADKLSMAYTRDNYQEKSTKGERNLEIYFSSFKNGNWSQGQSFAYNNKDYSVGHPSLTADGKTMYFVSDMPGGLGGTDIYVTKQQADGTWSKPENLGATINTEGNEMFPFIHENGVLLFSSDGQVGLGGLDIFAAKITDGKISKPQNLGYPVNDRFDDFGAVLNSDMTQGYFSSNRPGKGDDDIYSLTLNKPLRFGKLINVVTKDKATGEILPNTMVTMLDDNGKTIGSGKSNAEGKISFEVENDVDASLTGKLEKYFDGVGTAATKDKEEVAVTLLLEKDPGLSLFGLVTDEKSKLPLEGVKVEVVDNMTGQPFLDLTTGTTGDFRKALEGKKVGERLSYNIKLSKDGYLGKTVTFNTEITKPGEIKVHEALDLSLGKPEVGQDIGKLIQINPIYFDLGKWNIRPDAAKELDKIVKVMNDYPSMVIELGSHTDCRASAAFNLSLSDKRAKSSAAYIVSKGISNDRITGKGYGESKLVNNCACEGTVKSTCTEDQHQANRRTEFIIVKM